ncbi:MAG: PspA/IM30 family protein [Actinomycetota bacterium]|nr:PspA/IM30 family protein [Actinomycetota bacterium]
MATRLSILIRAKLSRRLDRAENPGAAFDYSYARQAEQLTGLRNAILELVTAKKRLERQAEHRRADIARLNAGARRALALGDAELARRAIERKRSIAAEFVELVGQVADLETQQAKMVASERANRGRLERFRTQKEVVKATYSAAQAQLAAGESAAELSAQLADVSSQTRRMQDQVDEISVRASALEELERAGLLEMPDELE